MITAVRVRAALHYNPDTGTFTRLDGPFKNTKAGSPNNRGYINIMVDGKLYKAHRLAWLYMLGQWPNMSLDHINMAPGDNRWANIRIATHSQNCANKKIPPTNTSGLKGVTWKKRNQKWCAQIKVNGQKKHIGLFDTREAAHAEYCKVASAYFGDFARAA